GIFDHIAECSGWIAEILSTLRNFILDCGILCWIAEIFGAIAKLYDGSRKFNADCGIYGVIVEFPRTLSPPLFRSKIFNIQFYICKRKELDMAPYVMFDLSTCSFVRPTCWATCHTITNARMIKNTPGTINRRATPSLEVAKFMT